MQLNIFLNAIFLKIYGLVKKLNSYKIIILKLFQFK